MTGHLDNASLARRLWEAFSDGDAAQLRKILTPDVVWRSHGDNPFSGEVKGVFATCEHMARSGEGVDALRSRVRDIFAGPSGAVIWATTDAERGPKSLHVDSLLLLRIADGRVYEVSSIPMDQKRNDAFWRLE